MTFVNQSNEDVDVHVLGVAGTRPGPQSNPASGSLLGHGRTVLTVPKNGQLTVPLAVNPNRGEYHLTTDRSDANAARGTIRVNRSPSSSTEKGIPGQRGSTHDDA